MSTETNNTIDISKLDKAEVLRVLYNDSKQQGMGFLNPKGREPMTHDEAKALLAEADPDFYFDYVNGRVMKIDLRGDTLDPWGYDRDNGQGSAAAAIARIKVTA